ncbi:MAG: regulatory protein RecX [Chloroflexota bacterium]
MKVSPRRSKTTGRHESFADRRARRAAIEDPTVVLDAGLRFLEARPRSIAEVQRRLASAGYREDLVAGAIERLVALGVLDDEAFATQWVESRDRARPRGERALQRELWLKGIGGATIDRVLSERRPGPDAEGQDGTEANAPSADEVAARRVIERSSAALARVVDPRSRRQKAYAILIRKGFASELAGVVAREHVETAASEDD